MVTKFKRRKISSLRNPPRRPISNQFRKWILVTCAVGFFCGAGYTFGGHLAQQRRINEFKERYESVAAQRILQYRKPLEPLEKISTSFRESAMKIIEYRERETAKNIEKFLSYLKQPEVIKQLQEITASPYERIGVIRMTDNGFKIEVVNTDVDRMILYIDQIRNNNFSNVQNLIELVDKYPNIKRELENIAQPRPIDSMFNIYKELVLIRTHVPEATQILVLRTYNEKTIEKTILSKKKADETIRSFNNGLAKIRTELTKSQDLGTLLTYGNSIMCVFHTRPLPPKNEIMWVWPTKENLTDSLIYGPAVLFAQEKGIIYASVYSNEKELGSAEFDPSNNRNRIVIFRTDR